MTGPREAFRQQAGRLLLREIARATPRNRRIVELIEGGADMEARDKDKNTPLLLAVKQAKNDAAYFLITRGANLNAEDGDGKAALYYALCRDNKEIAALLLDREAGAGRIGNGSSITSEKWDDYYWSRVNEIRAEQGKQATIPLVRRIQLKRRKRAAAPKAVIKPLKLK